jgi:uncharacterized protein (TIGR03435 family)
MRTCSSFRTAACTALISLVAASAAVGQTASPPAAAPAAQAQTAPPPAAAPAAQAQTAPPPIAFEVASIKPSAPLDPAQIMSGQAHLGMHVNAARVDLGFTPLMGLVTTAYKVKPFQVTGPAWMNSTMFDIVAKLPEGATKEQIPEMLQALLADRFKMTMHRENKEHAEFNLLVAKGGAKLKEAEPEPAADPAAAEPTPSADAPAREMTNDTPEGRVRMRVGKDGSMKYSGPGIDVTVSMASGMMHMEATRITMKSFAELVLSQFAGTPVVDKTELKGSYQLTLDIPMEELMAMARASGAMAGMGGGGPAPAPGQGPAGAASDPSGPSVFAMVQRYGLKLVSLKAPVDFIVIDHIEKTPTEN